MKELKQLKVKGLKHAPWNPRTAAELDPKHPAMADLIGSVNESGIISPIDVWVDAKGGPLVIAGNRRLVAAQVCGLKTIPALCFSKIKEAEARVITRSENEQRFGIEPKADAELLRSLRDLGFSQTEIAARLGASEAMVCRRMKLLDMAKEVVEAIKDVKIDVKAMEEISSYPEELQKKAAKVLGVRANGVKLSGGEYLHAGDVRRVFYGLTNSLDVDSWIFKGAGGKDRKNACKTCSNCTGSQPMLFDDVVDGKKECMGRCLDLKCFKRMQRAALNDAVEAAIEETSGGKGADGIVWLKSQYEGKFTELTAKKRGGKNTFAYVVSGWFGDITLKWGPDPKIAEAEKQQRKEDETAAAEVRKKELEDEEKRRKNLDDARAEVAKFMLGHDVEKRVEEVLKGMDRDALVKFIARIGSIVFRDDEFYNIGHVFDDCRAAARKWAVEHFDELAKRLTIEQTGAIMTDAAAAEIN